MLDASLNLKEVRTAKRYAEEHEAHIRRSIRGKTAKIVMSPELIRNAWIVNATAMSVKGVRMYPGRSRLVHESATLRNDVRSQPRP